MSLRYPDKDFLGIKIFLGASTAKEFKNSEENILKNIIDSLKNKVVFGGIIVMFGIK
jgi:hypothetical protein